MGLNIANENRVYLKTPNGAWVIGTPNFVEIKSSKMKCESAKVLVGNVSWTMSLCSLTTPPSIFSSGGGSMNATALKVKSDGQKVMRQDDTGSCNGVFINISTGVPIPCNCTFKILSAGQIKVKGE